MHVKTVLNEIAHYQGFVYGEARFGTSGGRRCVVVPLRARRGSRGRCAGCGTPGPTYDHLPERRFQFVPWWGLAVFFSYAVRRVNCRRCGIGAEAVPWATGKHHLTLPFLVFLASWAEDLPWQRVAERFRTSWQRVCAAVEWVVAYGLTHRRLDQVRAIGVDEVQYRKGQHYLTVVYQLDAGCRRLLWVGQERTAKSFARFFTTMRATVPDFCARVEFVCSDLWRGYLRVIRRELPAAVHLLDRFHLSQKFSQAKDQVRREEARRLRQAGQAPVLTKTRWCLLKKRSNLTTPQRGRLRQLLGLNLRTVRAYLLCEQFAHFWTYRSPTWARKFLAAWTATALASRLAPLQRVARMLRRHQEPILNYFRAQRRFSNGITEGLNTNLKLALRKARGYRSYRLAEVALYHQLGALPKPWLGHEFW